MTRAAQMRNCAAAVTAERLRVRIVGCGQWHRSDDQIGLLVAQRFMAVAPDRFDVYVTTAPGADLLSLVENVDRLVLVDAAAADEQLPIGGVRRIVLRRGCGIDDGDYAVFQPSHRVASGHSLGVGYALRLADALGIAPREVWLYAVGAATFDIGDLLTPAVAAIIEPTVARILRDLDCRAEQRVCAPDA